MAAKQEVRLDPAELGGIRGLQRQSLPASGRQIVIGLAAAASTFGVGRLLGVSVS